MRRQAWAVAILLGLALAIFLLWPGAEGPELAATSAQDSSDTAAPPAPSEPTPGDTSTHPRSRPADTDPNAGTPGSTPALEAAATPAQGELEVKVTAGGKPAAGSLVRLYWRGPVDPNTSMVSWRMAGSKATDDTGTARLPAPPGSYLIAARTQGFAPVQRMVTRPQGETVTRVELKLEPGVTLFGRTVARGEPVPLAELSLTAGFSDFGVVALDGGPVEEQVFATSDARGAFRVAGLAPGSYWIKAQAAGYARAARKIQVPYAGDLVLEMTAASFLEGFVIDAAGRPAAGAQVSITGALEPVIVSTGQGGGFSAEVEQGTYELSARRGTEAGSLARRVIVGPGATVRGLTVQLGEAGTIEGTVSASASGEPIPGADVAVSPYLQSGDSGRARTERDGSFAVQALPPGSYDVVASAPGFSPILRRGVTLAPGERFTLTLSLAGTSGIEGVVTDEAGQPVPGALVRGLPLSGLLSEAPAEARTDEQGLYRLNDIEAGRLRITASRGDGGGFCRPRFVDVREGETARVDLTLTRGGTLTGRVLHRMSSSQQALFVIALGLKGQGSRAELVQDDGSYQMELAPGSYQVKVFTPGRRPSWEGQPATIEAGKSTRLDLELASDEQDGTTGTVLEPDGSPSIGAIVLLSGPGHPHAMSSSGVDGRFTLNAGAGSSEPMSVLARNGSRMGRASGVRPGERGVRIQLMPPASLHGRLIDPTGRPVSGFTLQVLPAEPGARGLGGEESREFAGDRFALNEVLSGRVRILARTHDGRQGHVDATLAPGESQALEVTLLTSADGRGPDL